MAFDKRISKIEAILDNYRPTGESIKIIFADDPGFAEKLEKDTTADLQNGLEPDCITIHFHRPRPKENT